MDRVPQAVSIVFFVSSLLCTCPGLSRASAGWATPITANSLSLLWHSPTENTFVVGDRDSLRLFHAGNGSLITSVTVGDPGNCTPYTSVTASQPHAAVNDQSAFVCWQAPNSSHCTAQPGCRWMAQQSQCLPEPFYSTCNGNDYYFATAVAGGSSFVVCSSLGQCERRSAATLALLSTGPTVSGLPSGFPAPTQGQLPRGWYCGTPSFAAVFTSPDAAASVGEQYCPVWRYGPAVASVRAGDTAAGVIAVDSGAAGSPDVLYMLTSREERRDNGLFRPEFAGSNRIDEPSKRSLVTFALTGCTNPSVGQCSPVTSPSAYLTQSSAATVTAPLNVSQMYTASKLNSYVAGWTLGDFVYFAAQECVAAPSGACGSTVSKLVRFCRSTPTSAAQPASVTFNGYRKIAVGCGGRTTIVAAHAIVDPPPSLTAVLGPGAVVVMMACDTNAAGVRTNFAVCVHKLNGTAATGTGTAPTVDAAFTSQYGAVNCATQVPPAAQLGGVVVGTAAHSLLVYPQPAEVFSEMSVDVANGYAAVYLGGIGGTVIRLVLNGPPALVTSWSALGNSAFRITRTTVQAAGSGGVIADLVVDGDNNGIVVGQVAAVNRIDFVNCSVHSTCSACVNASSIYCGWCSLSAQCTTRQVCTDDASFRRASATFSGYWSGPGSTATAVCPSTTTRFAPAAVDVAFSISIAVTGLPAPLSLAQYYCRVAWPSGAQQAAATYTSGMVRCGSITLPRLGAPGRNHTTSQIVDVLYGASAPTASEVLQASVLTVYDCSVHTLCTACTASAFSCGWCPLSGTCVDTSTSCSSQATTTATCPAVASVAPQHFHTAAVTTQLTLSGSNFPSPGTASYNCAFQSLNVSATVHTSVATFVSPTVVNCILPPTLPGLASAAALPASGTVTYSVELRIDAAEIASSTPASIATTSVEVYDCSQLGLTRGTPDCSQCMSSVGTPRHCGWCFSTSSCSLAPICTGIGGWNAGDLAQCAPPAITSITPASGPTAGGTLLTIVGSNFGRTVADIGSVLVAGVAANVVSYSGATGELIVRVAAVGFPTTGSVIVTASARVATSTTNYRFVVPSLTQVSVERGPSSGGTAVIIVGEHIQAGNELQIRLGGRACMVSSVTVVIDTATVFCITSINMSDTLTIAPYINKVCVQVDGMVTAAECAERFSGGFYPFELLADPTVSRISPTFATVSGGTNITLTGTDLDAASEPRVTVLRGTVLITATAVAVREIAFASSGTTAQFSTPLLPLSSTVIAANNISEAVWLRFSFDGASVVHFPLTYISDPLVSTISPLSGEKSTIIRISGTTLARAGRPSVYFGSELAQPVDDLSDDTNLVVTLPPRPTDGPTKVAVVVVHGSWNYTHPNQFNYTVAAEAASSAGSGGVGVIIAGPVVGVLLLMVIVASVLYWHQRKKRTVAQKEMVSKMNLLETQVVDVCKQGFAELQGDSTLAMDDNQSWAKPRSMEDFLLSVCYTHRSTHPVPMTTMPKGYSDVIDLFGNVLQNEKFVRAFTRIIEKTGGRSIADKCHIAALLQTAIGRDSEYGFRIMAVLMNQLLLNRETRKNPKLVLRRTESIAEKYMSCWMARAMYPHLVDPVGKSMYTLFQALRIQAEKGPVDAVTGAAMYTLNGNYLLRDRIEFERLHIFVTAEAEGKELAVDLTVNSMDTPSQCVEKIVTAVSHGGVDSTGLFLRPYLDDRKLSTSEAYTLVEVGWPESGRKLVDIDDKSKFDPASGAVQLNTLAFYAIATNSKLRLITADEAASFEKKKGKERRSSISKSRVAAMKEAKRWHMRREKGASDKVLPGEVFLTYMLTMKGIVQPYVDELMGQIFSPTDIPPPVKRLFDFLDSQAAKLGIKDPTVRHIWKSNALPLRFWVNVVKNPEFLYDVRKSDTMNGNLSTVASVILDSCSRTAQPLGKNSSVNKLLYRGEVERWKVKVTKYYDDVEKAPPQVAVSRRGAKKSTITAVEANAVLLLLGYAAECRSQICDRLRDQDMGSLADDFLECCEAYEQSSKKIIAHAHKATMAGTPDKGGADGGYLEIANRSSVVLDSSLFDTTRHTDRWSHLSSTESLAGFGADFSEDEDIGGGPGPSSRPRSDRRAEQDTTESTIVLNRLEI